MERGLPLAPSVGPLRVVAELPIQPQEPAYSGALLTFQFGVA
jgi:hypothetical protein